MALGNMALICFPKHFHIGTIKNKRRQAEERAWKEAKWSRLINHNGLAIARVYRPSRGRYSAKQWLNYMSNVTIHLKSIHCGGSHIE